MARPTLDRNPKFKGLVRRLGIPRPHARGYLELLWDTANESGVPVFRDARAVEDAAEWDGEPGALASVLVELRLVDELQNGQLEIHDYWDHCPDYVRKRRTREEERRTRSVNDRSHTDTDRSVTGQRRTTADNDRSTADNGSTPAPTPAPTPTPTHIEDSPLTPLAGGGPGVSNLDWVLEEWNTTAAATGLAEARKLTPDRRGAIRARIGEHGVDALRTVLQAPRKSKFLRGEDGRDSWRGATLDWLLKPGNFVKTLEGQYRDGPKKGNGRDPLAGQYRKHNPAPGEAPPPEMTGTDVDWERLDSVRQFAVDWDLLGDYPAYREAVEAGELPASIAAFREFAEPQHTATKEPT